MQWLNQGIGGRIFKNLYTRTESYSTNIRFHNRGYTNILEYRAYWEGYHLIYSDGIKNSTFAGV